MPEATNASEEMYGMERLESFMRTRHDLEPKQLLEDLRRDVGQFVGAAPQFDDLTMLALKIRKING